MMQQLKVTARHCSGRILRGLHVWHASYLLNAAACQFWPTQEAPIASAGLRDERQLPAHAFGSTRKHSNATLVSC